jgi:hypothetical protein
VKMYSQVPTGGDELSGGAQIHGPVVTADPRFALHAIQSSAVQSGRFYIISITSVMQGHVVVLAKGCHLHVKHPQELQLDVASLAARVHMDIDILVVVVVAVDP